MRRDGGRLAADKPYQVPNLARDAGQLRRAWLAAPHRAASLPTESGADLRLGACPLRTTRKSSMFRMSIIVAAASLAFALPALAADLSYGDEPSQLAPAGTVRI